MHVDRPHSSLRERATLLTQDDRALCSFVLIAALWVSVHFNCLTAFFSPFLCNITRFSRAFWYYHITFNSSIKHKEISFCRAALKSTRLKTAEFLKRRSFEPLIRVQYFICSRLQYNSLSLMYFYFFICFVMTRYWKDW